MTVKAKKHLGQHFLKDENIAKKITNSLSFKGYNHVLEIGPGMGVLTKYLLEKDTTTHHKDQMIFSFRLTATKYNQNSQLQDPQRTIANSYDIYAPQNKLSKKK